MKDEAHTKVIKRSIQPARKRNDIRYMHASWITADWLVKLRTLIECTTLGISQWLSISDERAERTVA